MEKRVEIRVQAELLEQFDKAVADNYTDRSVVLRQAMVDYVRQNQKGEDEVKYSVYCQDKNLMEVPLGENLSEKQAIKLAERGKEMIKSSLLAHLSRTFSRWICTKGAVNSGE